jgi:hypothetical protein
MKWIDGFMKYDAETDYEAMTYVPSLIKIESGIHRLIIGYTDTSAAWASPCFN